MATIVDIADAMVDELNAASFSLPVTAARYYVPVFELPDMTTLHVSVVPKSVEVTSADRGRNIYEFQIDVAVQKKFETGSAAEIDPLMAIVEEIADFFRMRRLAAYPAAHWIKTEYVSIYSREHWEEMRQFTSVLTVTFQVIA